MQPLLLGHREWLPSPHLRVDQPCAPEPNISHKQGMEQEAAAPTSAGAASDSPAPADTQQPHGGQDKETNVETTSPISGSTSGQGASSEGGSGSSSEGGEGEGGYNKEEK